MNRFGVSERGIGGWGLEVACVLHACLLDNDVDKMDSVSLEPALRM